MSSMRLGEILQVFDFMKNDLEADLSYLGCDVAVRGYFLVVFFAMRVYFKILQRLHEREFVGKVSVRRCSICFPRCR